MYIPSSEERIKIYKKLNDDLDTENNPSLSNYATSRDPASRQIFLPSQTIASQKNQNFIKQSSQDKKMSKQQLSQLIERLTKNTKRQYLIKEHIQKISSINLQRKQKEKEDNRVQERLIRAGKAIEEKKERMRVEEQKKEEAHLKAKPTISERAQKKTTVPFIQRIDEIEGEREDLRRKLNQKYDPTFKPQLNPYSIFIAEVQSQKGFLQRVQEDKSKRQEAEMQKAKQKQYELLRGATFNPQINEKSRKIAGRLSQSSIKSAHRHKTPHNEPDSDHIPQINQKSRILAKQRQQQNQQFHQRLYDDMRKLQAKQMDKIRQQKQNKKNSNRPSINKNSLRILQAKEKINNKEQRQRKQNQQYQQYQQVLFNDQPLFNCQDMCTSLSQENQMEGLYEEVRYKEVGYNTGYTGSDQGKVVDGGRRLLYPKLPR